MKNRNWFRHLLSLIMAATSSVFTTHAATYYVATNGNDTAAGTNWVTAKATIQAGVNVATNGDTVLVGAGTYAPSVAAISISKGLSLMSQSGADVTTITGKGGVLSLTIDHTNAVVEGFSIIRCVRTSSPQGSVCVTTGLLKNCNIYSNEAAAGPAYCGGVFVDNGTVQNCNIHHNTGSTGGGVYQNRGIVQDCSIHDNKSTSSGGGLLVQYGTVRNCSIKNNIGSGCGGGVDMYDGTVSGCTIVSNSLGSTGNREGGGICIRHNGVVTDCVIKGNRGGVYGGGVACEGGRVQNCLIEDNWSDDQNGPGGVYMTGGQLTSSCIIRNHSWSPYGAAEVVMYNAIVAGCTISCLNTGMVVRMYSKGRICASIIFPGYVSPASDSKVMYSCSKALMSGVGNIAADPLFVGTNDFCLQSTSPCINAGSPAYAPPTDMDGKDRDNLPDMGAYEYGQGPNFVAGGYAVGPTPPDISVLSVSNRFRSNLVDIGYRVTDAGSVTVEVRGFATTVSKGPEAHYWDEIYPIKTLAESTDAEYGATVHPTNAVKHLAWDAGTDVGKSVAGLNVRLMASNANTLPLSFHFVTVPADTNGPAFQINRYAGANSDFQLQRALMWAFLKGLARRSGTDLIAVGGNYNDQVIANAGVLTTAGKNWLVENLSGVRLATALEIKRAREATTPGSVTKWPSYYRGGMLVNAYGVDTTDDNAWFLVKQ